MTSPLIQNELIGIIGKKIQQSVVNDVKDSGCYVLISDETTLHNRQFLTLGVRYVHQEMEGADSNSIFTLITSGLAEVNLPLGKLILVYINIYNNIIKYLYFYLFLSGIDS